MTTQVLGFSGSLRQGSYNTALLRAAADLLPDGLTLETFDLAPIPLYNEDVRQQGFPEPVAHFRERISTADALLIATPEYNNSIPGVLKNALDWASRSNADGISPLSWKPVGLMGAATGSFGTTRAQMHLRHMFVSTNSFVVNKPQVLVGGAAQKFDTDLTLTDPVTRGFVRDLLIALAELARKLQS